MELPAPASKNDPWLDSSSQSQEKTPASTRHSLPSLLKDCGKAKQIHRGMSLHTYICKFHNAHDTFLGNCLIEMYGNCDRLDEALSCFRCITNPNLHSWNILMNAFSKHGRFETALEIYHRMQKEGFAPNAYTFVSVLNASVSSPMNGVRSIHASIIKHGMINDVIVCTSLMNVYSKGGDLCHAKIIFNALHVKDVVSWNAMIASCTKNGSFDDALILYTRMKDHGLEPNHITLVCALDACSSLGDLQEGKRIHEAVVRNGYMGNIIVGNALLDMYGKCGSLSDVKEVFSDMPKLDVISWSTLISACVRNGCCEEGLHYFYKMKKEGIEPTLVALLCVIDACATGLMLEEGKRIHAIVASSKFSKELGLMNALISMYGKCESLLDAKEVFDQVEHPNVVTWNAMIFAYAQCGHNEKALELFKEMQTLGFKGNEITFSIAFDVCASLRDLEEGSNIHKALDGHQYHEDIMLGTALVNMYGKCGDFHNAKLVFGQMQKRDVALWSAIVTACASNGHNEEALHFFDQIYTNKMLPDPIAYVAALNACSNISRSEDGFKIHNELIFFGYEKKLQVETSLIDMYGKCGALDSARYVFEQMAHRDVVTWNAIMAACAQNGHGKEAIAFFHEMQKDSVKPDEITFVSLLSACNHMGMVEDGKRLFASMNKDYGLTQRAEHYMYTIDLLSRAGCVEDAQALIDIMPFEKDRKLWQSLLSSYSIHGKLEQGIEVAASMFPVDCEKDAPYILLSK